jgi:hypothetical protein
MWPLRRFKANLTRAQAFLRIQSSRVTNLYIYIYRSRSDAEASFHSSGVWRCTRSGFSGLQTRGEGLSGAEMRRPFDTALCGMRERGPTVIRSLNMRMVGVSGRETHRSLLTETHRVGFRSNWCIMYLRQRPLFAGSGVWSFASPQRKAPTGLWHLSSSL